ncbi:hypothetical protein [Acidiluteibacter ferrifornacis]|uniref:Uncharacterized protein n=1 Tax=Acidiluteibacter ferrifornacis TaxID=2692424 RepID=A0A6N9NMI8_9FLAO|nr:hypothetical protein [Acidiluteibacter ferrifornacis]NBG67183.1 hypothetical protein [Acidiluteibacter ferrifornacis]
MKKLLIIALLLSSSLLTFSQCKSFTKKNCLPALQPFISNGQMNAAKLAPGESAELQISFSKGLKYRLLLCTSDFLGEVEMIILDQNKNKLFNDQVEKNTSFWDFKAEASQVLTIQVKAPENTSENELMGLGCVTIMSGFQE